MPPPKRKKKIKPHPIPGCNIPDRGVTELPKTTVGTSAEQPRSSAFHFLATSALQRCLACQSSDHSPPGQRMLQIRPNTSSHLALQLSFGAHPAMLRTYSWFTPKGAQEIRRDVEVEPRSASRLEPYPLFYFSGPLFWFGFGFGFLTTPSEAQS